MFRIGIFFVALVLAVPVWARGKYSIVQGTTSGTVTHFTVVAPRNHPLNFEIIDAEENSYPLAKIETESMEGSAWDVRRLRVEGLDPKTEYVLLVKDKKGDVEEARSFGMLDPRQKRGKIGLASCMIRFLNNPLLWDTMREEGNRPDVFFFLGDQVYLDRASPFSPSEPATALEAWEEFAATRNSVDFYFWEHLIPAFSIWDDHDSGGNNVTAANYSLMPEVHRIYDIFFPNEFIEGAVERGPGLSLNFRLFGQNIIMLDGRSFRDLDEAHPQFGRTQEDWLLEKIQRGSNLIANGSQFFGKYLEKDSFEFDYPNRFSDFVSRMSAVGAEKEALFTFLSGDIHFSELQAIEPETFGYPTFEITSSPAHSTTFPGRHFFTPENPRRMVATSTHNIINLEMDYVPGEFSANVKSIGWRGNVLFERRLRTSAVSKADLSRKSWGVGCKGYLEVN